MLTDTRNLTVASDHLRAAYEEILRAEGCTERSMVESAVLRTRDHLDLVLRRLEQEATRKETDDIAEMLEQTDSAVEEAWRIAHAIGAGTREPSMDALEIIRVSLLSALALVEEATAEFEEDVSART